MSYFEKKELKTYNLNLHERLRLLPKVSIIIHVGKLEWDKY